MAKVAKNGRKVRKNGQKIGKTEGYIAFTFRRFLGSYSTFEKGTKNEIKVRL
jgi:hypothetical protein